MAVEQIQAGAAAVTEGQAVVAPVAPALPSGDITGAEIAAAVAAAEANAAGAVQAVPGQDAGGVEGVQTPVAPGTGAVQVEQPVAGAPKPIWEEYNLKSESEFRTAVQQTVQQNQAMQADLQRAVAYIEQLRKGQVQQQPAAVQQPAVQKPRPKYWSEAFGHGSSQQYEQAYQSDPVGTTREMFRYFLKNDPDFQAEVRGVVAPELQPIAQRLQGFEQQAQTNQQQQAAAQQQAVAVERVKSQMGEVLQKYPEFNDAKHPAQKQVLQAISEYWPTIQAEAVQGGPSRTLAMIVSAVRAETMLPLVQAQNRATQDRLRQAGFGQATARPGGGAGNVPATARERGLQEATQLGMSTEHAESFLNALSRNGMG